MSLVAVPLERTLLDAAARLGQAQGGSPIPVGIVLAAVALVVVALLWWNLHHHRAIRESLARLVARGDGWHLTVQPCGYTPDMLAGRTDATPRGDRRYSVRHGVEGPVRLTIGGQEVEARAAMFEWTYEQRRSSRNSSGRTTTSYQTRTELVGVCRLPVVVPRAVRIRGESVLGRVGLTRGGQQVESAEFNRRFRVEGRDERLTVQLLDPTLQQELLERYQGRTLHLDDDLLVLGGRPSHRDDSLTGVVGWLPAIRQDMDRLVRAIPAQFWRAVADERQG